MLTDFARCGALSCPSCAADADVVDEFCEQCGAGLASTRSAARRRVEIDCTVAAAVSDVGRVRTTNQDAVSICSTKSGLVIAVADGVSSSPRAEVAAVVAACRAAGFVRIHDSDDDTEQLVRDAITDAALAVARLTSVVDQFRSAPSSTIVLAVQRGDEIVVGWAGDSRAYWFDGVGMRRLTTDHSWAQEHVDAGSDSSEAIKEHFAHAITRWLGADGDGECSVVRFCPSGAGRLVLCSDGLWNMLDDQAIAGMLAASGPALTIARTLVDGAIARGGLDNVTVAVVDHDGRGERGPS